ncbi:hypothetical protein [Actinomadura sp. SCN-SB]|uniref:hypothetical protein n=1 Tax=Actinomadura sp. SCN-SB TaxID=3373092 RepID=UPI003752333C
MVAAERSVQRWETCGEAWIAMLRHVWSAGEAGLEDQGPIIEGPPVLFEIASLSWEDPLLREHGDRGLLAREAHERTRGAARPGPGPRPRGAHGPDRLPWVIDLLRARPWTTSAWIPFAAPPSDAEPRTAAGEPPDLVPRVVALSFRIRGYRLIMTAMFRSQDVIRCYLSYIPLRDVQVEVAEELGLPPGPLRIFIDVPHVRVADADHAAGILAAVPEHNAA